MSETRIDTNQANSWAQEVTLEKLYREALGQTGLLKKIAGVSGDAARAARETSDSIEDLGDRASTAADALDDAAAAAERARKAEEARAQRALEQSREDDRKRREEQYERERREWQYRQSLQDLRNNLNAVSTATPASLWNNLGDRLAVMGGNMTATGGASQMLGKTLTGLSKAATIASFALGAFSAGMDPFRQMLAAGIAFGGSVEQMQVQVGRTGLSLQDFSRIALEYSQQISGIGDRSFAGLVRTVQDTTREFGRYGQSIPAQAESIGAFVEILASGGRLYMMTEEQRAAATTSYLREQSALTRLTGISRKRLEDEQKAFAAQANVDLAIRAMRARGDIAGADQLLAIGQHFGGVVGPEMATAISQMAMGVAPQDERIRQILSTLPGGFESMQRMAMGYRSMTPEQMRQEALRLQAEMGRGQSIELMSLMAQLPGSRMAGAAGLTSQILRRGDVAQTRTAEQIEEVDQISRGTRGVLDRATTAYEQAAGDMARITGDLRSTVFTITQQLGIFSAALPALASATGGVTGLSAALSSFVGQGVMQSLSVAGIAGLAYGASRYGAGRAVRAAAGALPTPPGVPPLPPGVPPTSLGGTARAPWYSLAPRVGGGYMSGGLAGGALGLGLGAYQAATAQDFGSRMMGIGQAGLSGAMAGAMFGPLGILIGGAAGLGIGALSNYFGGGASAAGAAPELAASTNQLTIISRHLDAGGPIHTELKDLNNKVGILVSTVKQIQANQ